MVMDNKVMRVLSEPKRRRRRPPSSPDWVSLPAEMLDLILNHLIQLVDYLRFSAVCKPWLSAALYQKDCRRRESTHKQSVPVLLTPPLPHTPGERKKAATAKDHRPRRLYSVTENKLLNWELKWMPPYERFCGSSYGWLGAVNVDLSITLFNSFSGKSLLFPPVHPRPFVIAHSDPASRFWENRVAKLVCSCAPSFSNFNDDFVVGTIFGTNLDFAYINPGSNKGWTYITGGGFVDAVYHLGKYYVVDRYCRVISVDVRSSGGGDGGGSSSSSSETKMPQVQVVVLPTTSYTRTVYFMVSSGDADLLLVQMVPHPTKSHTAGFKIFKLLGLGNVDHQKFAEKVEIDNLGNDALFLGDSDSLCVSASNFRGCRPNCIYYIANCRDTNIYCLEDRSFMPLKGIKTRLKLACYPPPIWIVPTML